MKILTIAPTPFFADRGTHIRILEEARAQVRRGHAVTIATYHIGATPCDIVSKKITVRRIHRWLFWYKKLEAGPDWQKILLDILLLRKVLFLALRERPDVLHAHLHEGVLIGWCVQKILFWRKIILVADMHGSLVNEMASHGYLTHPLIKHIFTILERWVDNRGDIMVTSSLENKKALEEVRDGTVVVQLDGVDLSYYEPAQTEEERRFLRARYGIAPDAVVIVYTGAMVANKGLRYLLEAIPLVLRQCQHVHIILAGFPREHVDAFVAKNNIMQRVHIIAPLPYKDLPIILQMADIGVDPKDTAVQQASGKILQYMGAGLPVVCFDKENNRMLLGEDGIYATEISAHGLARALVHAVENTSLRHRVGTALRQRATVFSWDHGAEVFEQSIVAIQSQN